MTETYIIAVIAVLAALAMGMALKHADAMRLLIRSITAALAVLRLFAGPYRVIAFKPRSFGGIGLGFATWLGIIIAFPVCVSTLSPDGYVAWPVWVALIASAYLQMI